MASKEFGHGSHDNRFQAAASEDSDTAEHIQKLLTASAEEKKSRDGLNPHGHAIKSRDLRVEEKSPEQDGSDADQSTSGTCSAEYIRKYLTASAEHNKPRDVANPYPGEAIKSRDLQMEETSPDSRMEPDGSDVDQFPSAAGAELSPEDRQTILSLYQKCPQLWADFQVILDYLDVVDTHTPVPFPLLSGYLNKLLETNARLDPHYVGIDNLGQFAAVIGFVDLSVGLYREVLRDLGQTYVTDYLVGTQNDGGFLKKLRSLFLNFSLESMHFSLRLVQAGFLRDILEDLKHVQNMSADATGAFLHTTGVLHNWCRHAEVLPLLKQNSADIVTALAPFRHKTSGSQFIPADTLTVLSFLVEDDQLDLLRLHTNTAQYLLDMVKTAVDLHERFNDGWLISAVLCCFLRLVRWEYNRRLLIAQGVTKTLRHVLATRDRGDEEKQTAVDILNQLAQDSPNLRVLQNDRQLAEALETVATTSSKEVRDSANNLLPKIQRTSDLDSEDFVGSPSLGDLLADELNMLNICGTGEVEYVMERLTQFSAEGGRINSTSDVTRLKVLKALTELTRTDDGCRREIMARGALDELTNILRKGDNDEKAQASKILLELAFCEENNEIMKNRPAFMVCLSDATVATDNDDLTQTAGIIVQALNQ